MAKGKKSSGKNYTSSGIHSNVDRKITNTLRSEYLVSGERSANQLKAFRTGKRVVVTIENPSKEQTNKRFIRVDAASIWKNRSGEGFVIKGA
jgi:hypothetical protein